MFELHVEDRTRERRNTKLVCKKHKVPLKWRGMRCENATLVETQTSKSKASTTKQKPECLEACWKCNPQRCLVHFVELFLLGGIYFIRICSKWYETSRNANKFQKWGKTHRQTDKRKDGRTNEHHSDRNRPLLGRQNATKNYLCAYQVDQRDPEHKESDMNDFPGIFSRICWKCAHEGDMNTLENSKGDMHRVMRISRTQLCCTCTCTSTYTFTSMSQRWLKEGTVIQITSREVAPFFFFVSWSVLSMR